MKPVPAEVEFKGRGFYAAKERLKQLGGRYDKDRKSWWVPFMHREEAARQVELGKHVADGTILPQDPKLPPLKPRAYGHYSKPDGTVSPKAELVPCFECGDRVPRGALVSEYYCGCAERRAAQAQLTAGKRRPSPAAR